MNYPANEPNVVQLNPPVQKKKKRRKRKGKKSKKEGMGYGVYKCTKCNEEWGRPKSSADVSQDCPKCKTQVFPTIKPPGKTPYQGPSRCFGEFECTKCKKTWSSGNSWANMGQECRDCIINIYPHSQRPLLRRKGDKKNKRHLDEHCEMCKTIKNNCTVMRSSSEQTN